MTSSSPEPELIALQERRKQKRWRSHLNYSIGLLLMMLVAGTAAGIFAYQFGIEALKGVKPSPPSVKLPTLPPTPPKKQSFFLDEYSTIAEAKAIQANGLEGFTRPVRSAWTPTPTPFLAEHNYQTRLDQIRARIEQASATRLQELRQLNQTYPPEP